MIKAEQITQESNTSSHRSASNKALIMPWSVTAVVVLLAVAITYTSIHQTSNPGQASQLNTSQSSTRALTVAPAINTATPAEAQAASLQAPASTSGSSTGINSDGAATSLGAANTPALNTADTVNDSQTGSQAADPTQLNTTQLSN